MASYSSAAASAVAGPSASPAVATPAPLAALSSASVKSEPRIDALVLDAGPLLTQTDISGLAKKFYITPAVLAELKDKRARERFEFLRSSGQMDVEVREAGPEALLKVMNFAKKTGDYSVLSRPDLGVLALAYALEVEKHGTLRIRQDVGGKTGQQIQEAERRAKMKAEAENAVMDQVQPQDGASTSAALTQGPAATSTAANTEASSSHSIEPATSSAPTRISPGSNAVHDDSTAEHGKEQSSIAVDEDEGDGGGWEQVPSLSSGMQNLALDKADAGEKLAGWDEDAEGDSDSDGEWITPSNIQAHKNRALGLVTDESVVPALSGTDAAATQVEDVAKPKRKGKAKKKSGPPHMTVATMTGDFAVQNVLLQMGLALVSVEGMRITRVKSYVLRCHACMKICKDSERKFCPSCGNASLIRTSVTAVAPGTGAQGSASSEGLQVHLKPNFQYRNRGTIYSLPLPRAGTAGSKTRHAAKNKHTVPILREDQAEFQRGVASESIRRQKEERALQKALERGKDSLSARYEDPEGLSMLLNGAGGLVNRGSQQGLPQLGVGRKNPNERRRRKA